MLSACEESEITVEGLGFSTATLLGPLVDTVIEEKEKI